MFSNFSNIFNILPNFFEESSRNSQKIIEPRIPS